NTGKPSQAQRDENPYRSILAWFDKGNYLHLNLDAKDSDKVLQLYQVDGLHAFVKKAYPLANEAQLALMMEFVLHGLASYSLISKKVVDNRIEFNDLLGSIVNFNMEDTAEEEDI